MTSSVQTTLNCDVSYLCGTIFEDRFILEPGSFVQLSYIQTTVPASIRSLPRGLIVLFVFPSIVYLLLRLLLSILPVFSETLFDHTFYPHFKEGVYTSCVPFI